MSRPHDFSLRAVYDALDARRAERGLTWAAVGREVNRNRTFMRPLPALVRGQVLRWDARRLFTEMNVRRAEHDVTWPDVARQIGLGYTPGMLTRMAKGGRLGFPHVMRLVGWLDRPAVDFTRIGMW